LTRLVRSALRQPLDGGEGSFASVSNLSGAQPRLVDTVHERPSLRPLAPLLGVLAAMWLGAAGVIAQQLV
jgi:hypothetical protein